uniref:Uncharacterized protein n=1 Tax=Setaria italica TaxID=4555 RepID=K3ZGG8_SETIT
MCALVMCISHSDFNLLQLTLLEHDLPKCSLTTLILGFLLLI